MSLAADLVMRLARRIDARGLPALYRAVSVAVDAERARLDAAGRVYAAPGRTISRRADLRETGEWTIQQASVGSATMGGFAGVWGPLSIPPEIAGHLVAAIRLAQRLAIVYGYSPASDRGRMAVARALAAGFEVDMPDRGTADLRISHLVRRAVSGTRSASFTGTLARAVLWQTARRVGGRASRVVPVVSTGLVAADNRRQMMAMGRRMLDVFDGIAAVERVKPDHIQDAIEVGGA